MGSSTASPATAGGGPGGPVPGTDTPVCVPGRQRCKAGCRISHAAAGGCKSRRAAAARARHGLQPPKGGKEAFAAEVSPGKGPFPASREVSVPPQARPVPILAVPRHSLGTPVGYTLHQGSPLPDRASSHRHHHRGPELFRCFSANPGAAGCLPAPSRAAAPFPARWGCRSRSASSPAPHPSHAHPRFHAPSVPSFPRRAGTVHLPYSSFPILGWGDLALCPQQLPRGPCALLGGFCVGPGPHGAAGATRLSWGISGGLRFTSRFLPAQR